MAKAGAPIAEFFTAMHPDDVERVQEAIAATLAGNVSFACDYRLIQPDGSIKWVFAQGRCTMGQDGAPLRFPGVTFDISDQKSIEELMSVINMDDGRFARVNPAWTATLGWSEQELTEASFIEFLHPDDIETSETAFAQVRDGKPVLNFDNRYRAKSGEYRWLSWIAVPEHGKLYSTTREITAERAAQDTLLQAQEQEQLRQSQKMEAVGQLTGGLAHDFNNLMTIIRSAADFLRRPDLPDARCQRYIAAISGTVDRAAVLTSQLLAFARRQPLQPQVFDVAEQVKSVVSLVRPLMGGRVEMQLEVSHRPAFANADVRQFETALINLAVNGRDAMNGEGRLVFRVDVSEGIPA